MQRTNKSPGGEPGPSRVVMQRDRRVASDSGTLMARPPMTLGTMREHGVHHLIGFCLDDACRHQALIDVSKYADNVEVPSFRGRAKCRKCGSTRVDVRRRLDG